MPNEEVKVVGLSSNKKSGGKPSLKIILAIVGIVVLTLGIVAGIILVREQQNISEDAQQTCIEECPGTDGVLRNCHPPADDGTPQESVCSSGGLIKFCGSRNYCCPSAGAAWSSNLTLCATAAPTATATSTASGTSNPTGSGSPTATATSTGSGRASSTPTGSSMATPTPSGSGTSFPVPETGASWPTIMGAGIGVIIILTSLFLVF